MAGHIIAVVGGKGGVGKSVFSANLALAFLKNFKQRPLLVDLDLNSLGDQNLITGQSPKKDIVDITKLQVGNMDVKTLNPYMTNVSAGYSYVAAPRDAISARDINLDGLGKFLKSATNIFGVTVVDCGSSMEAHTMKALEHATAIFVVTTGDLIVINQTKKTLAKIQELLFPQEMVQIIVNRYNQRSLISPQAIQKSLNRQIFGTIPEDSNTCEASLAKKTPLVLLAPNAPIARGYSDLIRKVFQVRLLEKLGKLKKPSGLAAKIKSMQQASSGGADPVSKSAGSFGRSKSGPTDPWTAMKLRIHKALVEKMDLKKLNADPNDARQMAIVREKTHKAILQILEEEDTGSLLASREKKSAMIKEVLDEALGLGPLEDLLADKSVNEIMVNARDQIYVERAGKNFLSKVHFSSEQQMFNVIDRIVTPLGRQVNEAQPYVDARLVDGSRVHVIIPPLALRGPTITIRKFPDKRLTVKDLVGFGSMTKEIADFLRACVEAKLNIIVSGGTGSGKTTLLNVLSNFIPANERIITVEDSAELNLGQEHVVRLETRPKNVEGTGEVSIRELVKCCLRMKPDRIVVGECRAGEAFDMLQAMSTGHDGSLTTLHSNNPRDCTMRLASLVKQSGLSLDAKSIREMIASSVNLIIQQSRLSDGSRRITHVTEITGMQGEVISLQDIFLFKQEGMDKKRRVIGRFVPTGFIPKFVEDMEAKGMKVSRGLFAAKG